MNLKIFAYSSLNTLANNDSLKNGSLQKKSNIFKIYNFLYNESLFFIYTPCRM